ncbi:hypothetical protein [Pseudomonas syringae]|uniref:Uncharacterized protein n=1 Tax=Pseudomonas syringae TaxID=317 RepID=A0A085VNH5_PSESX|nr:hypothetical protein [Pseudomonas syringae]KFE56988.1 hypothetical protein IV01_07365 [Pseudomonas syringae]
MPNQSKVLPVQDEKGHKIGRQQLTPPLITELRTASKSIYGGGVLDTPAVDVIGTADPGTNIRVDDTAGRTLSCQTGADGIWICGRLILERGQHVFTALAYTIDPPVEPVQSPPFSINVVIGERFRMNGFYALDVSGSLYPCGSIIPIVSPAQHPPRLLITGQAGTRIQMANSGQSADTPAHDSPLWGEKQTIPYYGISLEVTPIGLLPISNWFHVRTVDELPPIVAKCVANFVNVG